MRLFGYYALHSFVNQIRKLFKTWVLVFVLACALMGGLIGFTAASLMDSAEETEIEIVEETDAPEDEEWSLSIDGEAILELVIGGGIAVLFAFEVIGADKNGGKIFLPADVNLLFPSPMKPQSVLMFRLATQLGVALAATVWLMFQLPNLILNLGLSGWTSTGILLTWFASLMAGKLLQVLLYTVCATHPKLKKYLRKGVYAVAALLAAAFLVYYKSGSQDIWMAAAGFFNAPVTRWIPFWGWLKGLTVFTSRQAWGYAMLCLLLLVGSGTALIYGIWSIDADFYEDAMAKSEETAALLEKAQSEKSTGFVVSGKKKGRKDSLLRDGMKHGWGASVFFHKTMYNRFRFAHFGFLTKTMETYLAAAVGTALILRFFADSVSVMPVALVLGGLVFYRSLGNPLGADTGMDFFRLIPESTWQKLFYSAIGGSLCCLMDLVLPMLAACAVLMVNPLKLLLWLPLIVSVDFYAASVVTFINLSVPVSVDKIAKQFLIILFIYFGLLPDAAILALGIVLDFVKYAVLAAMAANLLMGTVAFSLASVFLQPKGKDYVKTVEKQDLKAARKRFSGLALSIAVMLAVTVSLQIGAAALAGYLNWNLENEWLMWILNFAPQYLVGVPVCLLLMRKAPAQAPERHPLGFARGVKMFFICIMVMYFGNILGNLVSLLLSTLVKAEATNVLMTMLSGENRIAQFVVIVILAPLVEEYIFRKKLIDRMSTYGGKTAVLCSALLFGLYHGNLFQFFYAFGLGVVFGYIYLNTGKLRCSIIAHCCVNFVGSILAPMLVQNLPEALLSGEAALSEVIADPWVIAYYGYIMFLVVGSLVGLVLLCMNARRLRFPAGAMELPKGSRFRVSCLNVGMVLMLLLSVVITAINMFGIG